jgi:hypothetical protein
LVAVVAVAALFAAGCGGDASPTAPSTPPPVSGGSFGSQSAAISGQLVGGGGGSASSSFGATPGTAAMAGVQVSIQGTNSSTTTDDDGNFVLVGVPNGRVVLHISGGGTNANLTLNGVGAHQLIQIVIQVQATSATVVQQSVGELDEFEGDVDSVDAAVFGFTLTDGTTILTDLATWWDTGGDFFDYPTFAAQFNLGTAIHVEGLLVAAADGSLVATVIKAEGLDVADFRLEFNRDKWSLGWVDNGSSGSGSSSIEAQIEGGPFFNIDPATVQMTGPDGAVTPFATEVEPDRFEARFTKAQAISIATSVAAGDTVEVVVSGTLFDGTLWEVSAVIEITEDDDDDDDDDGGGTLDAVVAAQAIGDLEAVIDYINGLVADGDMAANNAKPLVTKLEAAIRSLEKLNGTPAVNQLGAFLNQLDAAEKTGKIESEDAEIIEEMVEDVIDLLEDNG